MLLSWHHWLLMGSAFSSFLGLCWLNTDRDETLTEAEITHQTLFRMAFANWLMYCAAILGECFCADVVDQCGLRVLSALAYLLTFCCVLGLPLHAIEQFHQRASQAQLVSNKRS